MALIRCASCGATNRVQALAPGKKAVCGKCKAPLTVPAFPDHPVNVAGAAYAAEVEGSPIPVLLDLWAHWCGPCLMLAPVLEAVARGMQGSAKVAKRNVDDNPQ